MGGRRTDSALDWPETSIRRTRNGFVSTERGRPVLTGGAAVNLSRAWRREGAALGWGAAGAPALGTGGASAH